MKPYIIFLLIILSFFSSFALGSKWQYSIDGNFIITLNTFSDNWNGANTGSIIWVSKLNGFWRRQLTNRILSENSLKLAFGQTKVQNKKTKKWSSPEKSSDNMDFLSILKFSFGGFIDPYASLSLNSQFLDNDNDSSIAYLNPVQLSQSFGIARELIKTENFYWNMRFGCALRQNIDFNKFTPGDSLRLSSVGTKIINDGGSEFFTEFRFRKGDFLKFSTKLRLYEAFISSEALKSSKENSWRYPDINLESNIIINVTKNILFNYYINVIYDKETGSDFRIKQTMGAGLGICFSSKTKK